MPQVNNVNLATEESEEDGNSTIFMKKLNRLVNKARMQDGVCDLRPIATDPEH